jgi:hypothetical protein
MTFTDDLHDSYTDVGVLKRTVGVELTALARADNWE